MAGYREKPLNRPAAPENGRECMHCKTPFAPEIWPKSKWTLSGWSPWCPTHHRAFSGQKDEPVRRGRKPKKMEMMTWTNLPS